MVFSQHGYRLLGGLLKRCFFFGARAYFLKKNYFNVQHVVGLAANVGIG